MFARGCKAPLVVQVDRDVVSECFRACRGNRCGVRDVLRFLRGYATSVSASSRPIGGSNQL